MAYLLKKNSGTVHCVLEIECNFNQIKMNHV